MKHLKIFETAALFESARATLDLPNVSLIEATMGVNYLPYVAPDPYNGHDYVEIGGIKWATMNIGASSITDVGLYFQWGDTQGYTTSQIGSDSGQKYFDSGWNDYKFANSTSYPGSTVMDKYNGNDHKLNLDLEDDAVRAAWGGNWRMPTKEEYAALRDAVNAVFTSNYNNTGVAGLVCTDKTDNSKVLFFPAGGVYTNGEIDRSNEAGYFWMSTLFPNTYADTYDNSYSFIVQNGYTGWDLNMTRYQGLNIRGIWDDSNS